MTFHPTRYLQNFVIYEEKYFCNFFLNVMTRNYAEYIQLFLTR
jgi:hypothetical protein